jgi:hypothetical protein
MPTRSIARSRRHAAFSAYQPVLVGVSARSFGWHLGHDQYATVVGSCWPAVEVPV